MQILDAGTLDAEVLKHTPRTQAAGLLYLMISKFFYESNYALLYYDGPDSEEMPSCETNSV